MILISHRGNVDGINKSLENKPSYLDKALDEGYDVEIDIWYHKKSWWLGHDNPQYKTNIKWMDKHFNRKWFHCKNLDALVQFAYNYPYTSWNGRNYFWHQNDNFTLTSNGLIWTYPGQPLTDYSICVLPEQSDCTYEESKLERCAGICSDYIARFAEL